MLPSVTIVIPVHNEISFIKKTLISALQQNYPDFLFLVYVIDGMSIDGTREIIKSFQKGNSQIKLIENPKKIVSIGLNKAIKMAKSDIIIRMDAHCEYPEFYVSRLVSLIQKTGADNVGGVLVAKRGKNYVQKSISAALGSPVSVGGAMRSYENASFIRKVDAVHGGCWWRKKLVTVGLFDEHMIRNQDDELSFRLRSLGGLIFQDSSIRVKYIVRDKYRKLFNQFSQYGYWKSPIIQKYFKQASLRHFLPTIFLLSLIILAFLSFTHMYFFIFFLQLSLTYIITIIAFSIYQVVRNKDFKLLPGIFNALVIIHFGYGLGFIMGVFRRLIHLKFFDPFFSRITR